MGGDGGTLNNSRHEHTRLRARVLGHSSPASQKLRKRQRASVTHCEASKMALQPPHVVVDRLGLLYNKDALISCLLHRARHKSRHAFSHIASLKKDTAHVNLVEQNGQFICPVTKKVVTAEGSFSVGWSCGCVTANVVYVQRAVRAGRHQDAPSDVASTTSSSQEPQVCISCAKMGERIPLGMTFEERQAVLERVLAAREKSRSLKKKKRKSIANDADPPVSKIRKLTDPDSPQPSKPCASLR
ncbi:Protein RTF2-like [Gracilariopsis chorda]|uniref:Protein RTF2-like n=1 Tax=Gracilariopsis chorda TaxID=448386 RepID=A0A2V3IVH5_9FLOR|nr:Protein RTF2-like [Gracilariopsis chorda]|eukprot:PXF46085.1 Protein RTF2-like [Gracilariopsis chorda]